MFKTPLRIWAMFNHFVVWISAIIVTGIMSWIISVEAFGSSYPNRAHIIYQEVVVRFGSPFLSLPSRVVMKNLQLSGRRHACSLDYRDVSTPHRPLQRPFMAREPHLLVLVAHVLYLFGPGLDRGSVCYRRSCLWTVWAEEDGCCV